MVEKIVEHLVAQLWKVFQRKHSLDLVKIAIKRNSKVAYHMSDDIWTEEMKEFVLDCDPFAFAKSWHG